MQLFKLKTRLSKFGHFADFAREFKLSEHDLVITNEFLYEPFMKSLNLPCHFIMQEKFGLGEPSDKMMNTILKGWKTLRKLSNVKFRSSKKNNWSFCLPPVEPEAR